ncbi:MerR family transcriptional regulator [Streptomyces longwoodensis]|uniref:MerR family transcriptional regulator n=1 Tax=Streptomyces longwoodensis TaxID=68231 RepID=UPI00225621CF|nr:MerR family transcriptional regulator [Streptomyces longwoodensis]MCX5000194.1 MerR family transcriptional regulator [Streptomyces longwoodensis]WTI48902.1 MerR family transcriptional regulator [Streptomyces longwoodensis]
MAVLDEPEATADAAGLTTGAVARRLGVSPTTLRSWDRRYGLGPAVRAEGRHRRWSPADIAMVEEMCRLTSAGAPPAEAARVARLRHHPTTPPTDPASPRASTPPAPPRADGEAEDAAGPVAGPDAGATDPRPEPEPEPEPGPRPPARRGGAGGGLPLGGDVRQECRGLARAAVRLDAPELEQRLLDAVDRHGLVVAWEEVMVPTLRAVGRKWESSGDRYVEVEHLLSWHISSTLRGVPFLFPRRDPVTGAAPVVLACTPGEQHSLPLEVLTAALAERGLPTRTLGAAVPTEALLACVRRTGPAAVVLWAQTRSTASLPLARHVAGLEWGTAGARRRPTVLPAGPGWDRRASAGFPRCSGLREAVDTLGRLCEDGARLPARGH